MENESVKIKFYSLGSEKVDLIKKKSNDDFNYSKAVFSSSNFDNALMKVIDKDINSLDIKVNKIISNLKMKLDELNIKNDINISYGINEINRVMDAVDKSIVDLLEYKNNNKVRVFSSDKKGKKEKLRSVDNLIEYLRKSKTEIISMNNEYIKLCDRKKTLLPSDDYLFDDNEEESPLERTINFYVNQKEEAKI